ncbi:CHC2 zinc finger domain-containing protein, partial [Parabacteroides sp. B2-S-102]|uniref:CHC2 zinc finger domain-containing protein n=1 Tax=Parabacteroides sp. B2-S-102 TaxID=2949657 RepID=UPI00202F309A
MNIQEVKNIRIADYLQSLGYTPVKQQGNSLWYKSPLREEKDASFKVNTELNKWYDFGLGKGGNIIALAEELYATDYVPYLLNKIAERVPHIRPVSFFYGTHALPISICVPVIRSNSRLYLVIRFSSNTFSSIPTLS